MPVALRGPPTSMCDVAEASVGRGVHYCEDQSKLITISDFNPSATFDDERQFEFALDWNTAGSTKQGFRNDLADVCYCPGAALEACTVLQSNCLSCDTTPRTCSEWLQLIS